MLWAEIGTIVIIVMKMVIVFIHAKFVGRPIVVIVMDGVPVANLMYVVIAWKNVKCVTQNLILVVIVGRDIHVKNVEFHYVNLVR